MKHNSPPAVIYVTTKYETFGMLCDQYNWINHDTDRKSNSNAYSISTPELLINASVMCIWYFIIITSIPIDT